MPPRDSHRPCKVGSQPEITLLWARYPQEESQEDYLSCHLQGSEHPPGRIAAWKRGSPPPAQGLPSPRFLLSLRAWRTGISNLRQLPCPTQNLGQRQNTAHSSQDSQVSQDLGWGHRFLKPCSHGLFRKWRLRTHVWAGTGFSVGRS